MPVLKLAITNWFQQTQVGYPTYKYTKYFQQFQQKITIMLPFHEIVSILKR